MHGIIIARHAGALHAFRLTLPAYFELDRAVSVSALIGRLQARTFTLADLRAGLRAVLLGGGASPVAAAEALERLRIRDMESVADIVGATVAASLLPPASEMEEADGDGDPVTMGDIYATGFAIGLKPREIDELTPWEFSRCVAGWNQAHSPDAAPAAPKQDEMAELFARYG